MAIAASGIISGLDVASLIRASMTFERLPLERAQKQLSATESKISAVGQVKSAIAGLQEAAKNISDSSKLYSYKASVGNADVASVTASGTAAAGKYSLEVSQLATSHKLTSAANLDVSSGGTLNIQVGNGASKTVNIAAGASLSDAAKAINDADAGVSATVVNGANGAQLMLTSNETGASNEIKLNSTISGLDSGSMTEVVKAQNARLSIDGIAIESASNTVTNAVTGVDLTLKSTTTTATQVSVNNDTSELETRVKGFVDAYNKARDTMRSLSQYDASGDKNHGVLNGDGTVSSALSELRGLLSTVPAGASAAFSSLVDMGIETSAAGVLSINTSRFKTASETDFTALTRSIAAYGSAFEKATAKMTGTDGLIANRLDGLSSTSTRLKDTISVQERRLVTVQARYEKQFANLETLLSSMTSTGNYLSQQLASLASLNRS
ncbi:MAG: flagellar filament capping protein FliD [Candidatus Accumulibacter sp.]|jgi:flagellar hook-associated protein 2|nr:flagellar filament capping protein FliD [Accumulibacter sp.]